MQACIANSAHAKASGNKRKVGESEAVLANAAYKTPAPAITNSHYGKEIIPALPYIRPRTKEGFFRKHYVYVEHLY
ncbi:hypothetical protein J7E52_20215 [Bacillus sp. ISL-34]|nr:hypothetical protein [Bacillus sp. ISL-34]